MRKPALTRRGFSIGLMAAPFLAGTAWAQAILPAMTVTKDPNCGCCGGWVEYVRNAGFAVDVVETADLNPVKTRLGVPADLASCHTAEIGGYVIEGHVPHPAIRRLLAEKPRAIGLAVPGMPQSSPGMDVPGATDSYDVILFGPAGQRRFARYRGRREI
ncbi:MAG: DUF411 domain-containing protein [Pseudolabrys sp.]|nr:DUF411 domain-containing protein [Pseudolabrys sp.]